MAKNIDRFKTRSGVFDEFTNRNLFELQSRDVFDEVVCQIKVGKESNVFLVRKGEKLLILKIYRLQNCDFLRMYDYIRKDPRYEFLKQHRRDIIFAWTQREYKNLLKAGKAKVSVPQVLVWKFNIIVEEMIGSDNPAPQLKDAYPKNPGKFWEKVVNEMRKLYQVGLIHGDLSAFNILNFREKPYLIDFSQATLIKTPNSEELLKRDINNMIAFFKKLGVKADFEETFKKIIGK